MVLAEKADRMGCCHLNASGLSAEQMKTIREGQKPQQTKVPVVLNYGK